MQILTETPTKSELGNLIVKMDQAGCFTDAGYLVFWPEWLEYHDVLALTATGELEKVRGPYNDDNYYLVNLP